VDVTDKEVAVPSFRRRASVIDADHVEEPSKKPEEAAKALALAEEAEAEAAEAEAIAAAARARARAIRLRREAEVSETETTTEAQVDTADTDAAADEVEPDVALEAPPIETSAEEKPARRRWVPRIKWTFVAAGLAMLCIGALVAASGYMVWQHRAAQQEQQQTAEYVAAARQGVVTLMSLDHTKAQDDVQRIIDNTTGQFKEDFEAQRDAFAQVAKDSKVVTEVTVNVVAVKEMTDTTAQVLVSATSRVTNAAGANQDPRPWRLMVDLVREGDQIKMSKVEFVL
jgi:Mce-associated membrane protein